MADIDLDGPDLTALALGEADGERLDRALDFLIRSEEARAMAAETRKLGESLSAAFGGESGGGLSESLRAGVLRAARRQVWSRRLKRVGLTAAVCAFTAAATLAGAAVLPSDGGSSDAGGDLGSTAASVAEHSTTPSGGLELGLPVAAAGEAGRFYRLSMSADAVQAAAQRDSNSALGPEGQAPFGPVAAATPVDAPAAEEAAESGIDETIALRLDKLGIASDDGIDDATYFRRLYLDCTGAPPAPAEVEAFVNEPASDKREKAADRLLAGTAEVSYFQVDPSTANDEVRSRSFYREAASGGRAAFAPQESEQLYPGSAMNLNGLMVIRGGEETFGRHGLVTSYVPVPNDPGYPTEVRTLVEELDGQEERIRRQVERMLRGEKFEVLARLRELQERYTRAGRLDDAIAVRALVRKLEGELLDARPDPGRLSSYRGRAGETLHFRVTGDPNAGTVWGSDVYTDDSSLAAAAVHAGALAPGETGVVKVTILPGRDKYETSARGGVTTNAYGPWQGSYRVEKFDWKREPTSEVAAPGSSMTSYRGRVGESVRLEVTGDPKAGTVWGTDIYTDDSPLAAAAVHAGALEPGETGFVTVTILPGQPRYSGSYRHGVASRDYRSFGGSYRVARAEAPRTGLTNPASAEADPGNLTAFRPDGRGASGLFRVTGSNDGSVWGTDLYTTDSDLSTAAVHAGLLNVGETGVVEATIIDGQPSYAGSSRYGVASRPWQSYEASYRLERIDAPPSGDPKADTASVGGKYRRLLTTIDAPDDVHTYDKFRDFGRWEGTSYRGRDGLPQAYWVYVAPTWYLWAESTEATETGTSAPPSWPSTRDATPNAAPAVELEILSGSDETTPSATTQPPASDPAAPEPPAAAPPTTGAQSPSVPSADPAATPEIAPSGAGVDLPGGTPLPGLPK